MIPYSEDKILGFAELCLSWLTDLRIFITPADQEFLAL